MRSDETIKRLTSELREDMRREGDTKKTAYFHEPTETVPDGTHVWKLRLELSRDPAVTFDLTIDREVSIGRDEADGVITLFPTVDAEGLGMSRKHAMFRPTATVLYLLDLGSTNGTRINTRPLGVNTPYPVMNGDMVAIGRLEFIVRIVHMPRALDSDPVAHSNDTEVIVPIIARAISTQLAVRDVIKQAMEMARMYTPADEVSIWLIDEMTGELFLSSGEGMENQKVFQLPLETTLAGKAIREGKPQRSNRKADGAPIKLKTGYIAEGVIYVPLTFGDMPTGVLSAVHREPGKVFTDRDERLMVTIANITAIAIQNARLYQRTRQDLTRRSKVVSAMQYALSQEIKRQLGTVVGYTTMLQTDGIFSEETRETLSEIRLAGENMLDLIERLTSMARLSLEPIAQRGPCDLVDVASRALESLQASAESRKIVIHAHVEGKPFNIWGDSQHLFHSVYNLLENAITFTPNRGEIGLRLVFAPEGITIMVSDTGPGIPEEELFDLFNRFFHRKPHDDSQGVGLGLEIVRTTVEAHMGTVTANNRPEGGAEFVITLPASARSGWAEGAGQDE